MIAIITAILVFGIRESANFNSASVFVKVATVLTFIAVIAACLLGHPSTRRLTGIPSSQPRAIRGVRLVGCCARRRGDFLARFYTSAWAQCLPALRAISCCRTPRILSIVVGFCVALFASLLPINVLGQLTSIGTLLAFVIVSAGVWILRVRRPDLPRPFKAPFVPLTPMLAMGISFALMASLPWSTWLRLIAWLILGMAIYFGYGRKYSVLARARGAAK